MAKLEAGGILRHMGWLPAIFALVLGAAGWYYMFYSSAAQKLVEVEGPVRNRRRVRLRRLNGLLMLLLGLSLAVGVYGFDLERPGVGFALVWLAVVVLLGGIVVLAILDIRLTRQVKNRRDPGGKD
jgi:Na+/H+ antiporter NhaD/arsenite permease-like protein